jgi:hypothetical protein
VQRSQNVEAAGIPLGSAAAPLLDALKNLHLSGPATQQVIGGFDQDQTFKDPKLKAALVANAEVNGNKLPAHPTTAQLLKAAISPHHSSSYWDAVNPLNIVKDAIYTPVFTAEGGFALGHAAREALPKGLGGQGNTTDLKAIGEEQLNTLRHPGSFLQQHPFQAALAVIGGAEGAGGIAGRLAKLPESERIVPLSNFEGSTVNRGFLDQNLVKRAAQVQSDKMLANGPKAFQARALGNRATGLGSDLERQGNVALRKLTKEYHEAGKGINRREQDAILQNHAQAITPAEREAFYNGMDRTPPREAQANLAQAQQKIVGEDLNPKQRRFLDAARALSNHRSQMLKDSGQLSDPAALRTDYRTLYHVRASQGDPTASAIVDTENRLRNAKDPAEVDALNRQHDALVQKFVGEQQGAKPFRVGSETPKVASRFAFPGRSVRANANLPIEGIGKERSFGDRLTSGNQIQNRDTFLKQIIQPHTADTARTYVQRVVDPNSGLGAIRPENGQILTPEQVENYRIVNLDNLRTKPKGADETVNAADTTNREAAIINLGHDLNQAWERPGLTQIPREGNYALIPKPVADVMDKTVQRVVPGSLEHRAQQATHAMKQGVLMTRLTYPFENLVGNMFQNLPENVGPLSYGRAARNSIPFHPAVEDSGFVAHDIGRGTHTTSSLIGEGRIVRAVSHNTVEAPLRMNRRLSIEVDNFTRKGAYAKVGVREAKKLAGYNAFQRVFKPKNAVVDSWLEKMADPNATDIDVRRAAHKAVRAVLDLQGDYGRMGVNTGVGLADPFVRWQMFITKYMLKTLPLKHPIKTLLAYRVGQLGQQGTAQEGALPQYLQEALKIGGSPTAALTASFTRSIPTSSLGTMFEPDSQGRVQWGSTLGQLSPYALMALDALSGHQIESAHGTSIPSLTGDNGKPIDGADWKSRLEYAGSQLAGYVPPVGAAQGALHGGTSGQTSTSIPFLNPRYKPPSNSSAPRAPVPWWLPIANQVLPLRLDVRNQVADRAAGAADLAKSLSGDAATAATNSVHTPAEAKALGKKNHDKSVKSKKKQAYFKTHPGALAAALDRGTGSGR